MENSKTEEINSQSNMDDYSVFFSKAFADLIDLAGEDAETFIELFYNRKREYAEFHTIAENLYNSGDNVLVMSNAGTGKSNFIYRLFYEKDKLEQNKLYPIMIDYRKIPTDDKLAGMKLKFVKEMFKYFDAIDYSLCPVGGLDIAHLQDNLYIIQEQLDQIANNRKKTKQALVFIDDLDYAEKDDLFPVLEFLSPFARGRNINLLVCVRPPLFQTLLNNDSKFAGLFAHTSRHIELRPMDLHSILAMRLAPILAEYQNKNIIANVWDRIISLRKSPTKKYKNILKKLGVNKIDELPEIVYPFTNEYINFMQKLSLGNLREIFDIAAKSLLFILQNFETLQTVQECDEQRKIITKQQRIDLFSDKNSSYHLFDLHQNNSLYFNVLEAITICQDNLHNDFFSMLINLGHKEKDIENALKDMGRRHHRLLLPHDFTYAKDNLKEPVKYEITEKGTYYIQEVAKWDEYINKYGAAQTSLIDKRYFNE